MADLRSALVRAGMRSVEMYIQSGNVVVEVPDDVSERSTQAQVAAVLERDFGLDDVPVVAMPIARLHHAADQSRRRFPHDPAGETSEKDHDKLTHVVFCVELPSPTRRDSLDRDEFAPDRFALDVHDGVAELHVSYAVGAGASKLTIDRIERALGVRATGRNLATVHRLAAFGV